MSAKSRFVGFLMSECRRNNLDSECLYHRSENMVSSNRTLDDSDCGRRPSSWSSLFEDRPSWCSDAEQTITMRVARCAAAFVGQPSLLGQHALRLRIHA